MEGAAGDLRYRTQLPGAPPPSQQNNNASFQQHQVLYSSSSSSYPPTSVLSSTGNLHQQQQHLSSSFDISNNNNNCFVSCDPTQQTAAIGGGVPNNNQGINNRFIGGVVGGRTGGGGGGGGGGDSMFTPYPSPPSGDLYGGSGGGQFSDFLQGGFGKSQQQQQQGYGQQNRLISNNSSSSGSSSGLGAPQIFDNPIANNMVMNFGMQYGQQMIKRTQDGFIRHVFSLDRVRYYFTVNNSYVKNKLKLLLCPLKHKFRRREADRQVLFDIGDVRGGHNHHQISSFLPAVDDINAPDLYIPLMSFITYILLVGFFTGLGGNNFSPEVLLATGSSCACMTAVQLFAIRFGSYLSAATRPINSLDLLCWTSYMFFSVSICVVLKAVLLSIAYTISWLSFAVFHGIFLYGTLRTHGKDNSHRSTFEYFLYIVASMQIPIYFWLLHF